MPNPRRTTRKPRVQQPRHRASSEVREQARNSGKKTVKKVASTVKKATTTTPVSRGTQAYSQPRKTHTRATAPKQNKPRQNQPKKTTSVKQQNQKARDFRSKIKITNTTAKSQYSDFKKNEFKYKTKAEREKEKKKGENPYQKAYQRGKDITYLGTKQEKTKTSLNGNKAVKTAALEIKKEAEKKATFKSDEWKQAKKDIRKSVKKDYKDYLKKHGWSDKDIKQFLNSQEGKSRIDADTKSAVKQVKKDTRKEIDKKYDKKIKNVNSKENTLESVNALTKGEFNRMTEASRINNKKLGNLQLKGGKGKGEDIRKKVGSKTAESALKGKFATGAMQGLSYVDVFSGVGTYNKSAKKAIKKTKESGAYMAGYGVGMAGQMALGGTGAMGKSIAKAGAKAGVKQAAKSGAKQFAKNRAGELVAETPANILDAAKMSLDEKGHINRKEFAKWMAINSGLTAGMGGAIEGAGAAITRSQAKKLKTLVAKKQAKTITAEESKQYDKILNKLQTKAKSKETASSFIAEKGLEDNRKTVTKSANEAAENAAGKARAEFDTEVKNRRAKVEAKKEYEKKAVHLENNVAKAKQTRDTLDKSVKDLKALRRKDGTMAGHQEIVARYGSVERLDAVIGRTESALKKSRQRLRQVQTNLGTEKKRLQRANAKIDKEFPVESNGIKGESKAETPHQKTAEGKAGYKAEQKETHEPQTRLKELNAKNKKMGLTTYEEQEARDIQEKLGRIKPKEIPANETSPEVPKTEAEVKTAEPKIYKDKKNGHYIETPEGKKPVIRDEDANGFKYYDEDGVVVYEHDYTPKQKQIAEHKAELKKEHSELLGELHKAEGERIRLGEASKWQGEKHKNRGYLDNEEFVASTKETEKAHADYVKADKKYKELEQKKEQLEYEIKKADRDIENDIRLNKGETYRMADEDDIPWTKDSKASQEAYAGNRKVADSKEVDGTISKTTKEAEPPSSMPRSTDPDFREKGVIYKIRRALFNELSALDDIGSGMAKEGRDKFHAQTNAMRMARSTASAKVSEGLELFKKYGLTAKKNKQKLNDFQEYCWLKHDLEIFDDDPTKEFLGYHNVGNKVEDSRKTIADRMAELEEKYKMPEEWHNKVANLEKKIAESTDEKQRDMFERQLEALMEQDELPRFQEGMVKYFKDLLDMEVDAGLSSKEFADGLKNKYKNYVPKFVAREFDDNVTKTFKDELDIAKGMRAAKGGKAEEGLVPLYEQMVAKTNAVYKRTELNRTAKAMAEAWGINPQELETIQKAAKASDIDVAESIMDCAVFTPKPKNGQYKIWYYVNGDKHELPVSKEIVEEIRNWTGEQKLMMFQGALGKTLDVINDKAIAPIARLWKDFITDYSLVFGIKNHARDLETALFYTKDIKGYMRNLPKAYAAMFSRSEDSMLKMMKEAYQKNGGVYTQLVTSGKFDTNFYKSVFTQAGKVNPLRAIKELNSAMETIPRLAEFMSAMESNALKKAGKRSLDELTSADYEKFMKQALNDHDSIADAMYRAKDVTLNFDRGGWLGKKLNRGIVPFFNPSVQGLSKLARELTSSNIVRDEAGNIQMLGKKLGKDGKTINTLRGGTAAAFGFELAKLGTMVGAPVALLNGMFGDYYEGKVDGYGALSDYNKYTYYNIPIGDGQYIKIPRARELASMQDGIDWLFHHFKYSDGQNPDSPLFVDTKLSDLKNLGKISWEQIGPVNVVEDNLFSPIVRSFKGKTWYGSNIESWEDQDKIAEGKSNEVWDENTSALAKHLGNTDLMKKWGISPKKIDNALDGYLGIIYDMGLSQTSAKNEVKWKAEAEQHGPLGGLLGMGKSVAASSFMIDSVFQNRYKSDNYIKQDILNKEIDKLEKDGKTHSHEWNEAKGKLNKIKNAFSYNSLQFDETSARIYLDDSLSAVDKKKATRELAESQTLMWRGQAKGRVTSPLDPLAVVYNMRDSKGNRILPIRSMLEACSYTSKDDFGNETNNIIDAYNAYKKNGGKSGKFMKVTLASREVNRAAGASTSFCNWRTNAFAVVLNGIENAKGVLEAYGDKNVDYTLRDAQTYKNYKGTIKTYKDSSKTVTQAAYDIGLDYASKMEQWDKANALANKKHIDREFFAQGNYSKTLKGNDALTIMNAARCLSSDKYKKNWKNDPKEEINRFCLENKFTYKDGKKPDPEAVESAIRKKYGSKCTKEECAAVFWEICPWAENPFGAIGDYSLKGDTGIKASSGYGGRGGRRRGGRGRGRGGRGGSGSGSGRASAVGTAKPTKMGSYKVSTSSAKITTKKHTANIKVHDYTFKSNVNQAYRNKAQKLREDLRKETSKVNK